MLAIERPDKELILSILRIAMLIRQNNPIKDEQKIWTGSS